MLTVVFDDARSAEFYPLTLTRASGDLRCGVLKLRQRLEACFPSEAETAVIIAPRLQQLYAERHPDWLLHRFPENTEKLYLNSLLRIDQELVRQITALPSESSLLHEGQLLAAKTKKSFSDNLAQHLTPINTDKTLYNNISDLIHDNARMIRWDFEHYFYDKDNSFETEPGVTVQNPYDVWIGEDVNLAPGMVIDASSGPVILDEGCRVMANAVLVGPLYVGKKSLIKIGAKIYGGTSIGPVCKIGGEVEDSIIQAYSNKQHDGFLGHAYLGEWINLGADTNNSDLKNTYMNVEYYSYPKKKKTDSGSQFLGCIIGDHSKTGINCSINTGTVIGVGCNLWGSNLIMDFIPDFSWGMAGELKPYRTDAFCYTAALVKERRQLGFSPAEKALYTQIANLEY